MLYSYDRLRAELGIEETPLLTVFERYCREMAANTRVLEWSCKTADGRLEGARFLHTARVQDFATAQEHVDRVIAELATGDAAEPLEELRALGCELGQGVALGYADTGADGSRRCELKLYVSTDRVEDARAKLESFAPGGGPPRELPRIMLAVAVAADGSCTRRAYYLWPRDRLGPAANRWLAEWCTDEERRLIAESASRTVSVAFKAGRRDMVYLSVPLLHDELERMLLGHIAPHPIACAQLDHLRWIGFSKHGEGLAARELNAYFDSTF